MASRRPQRAQNEPQDDPKSVLKTTENDDFAGDILTKLRNHQHRLLQKQAFRLGHPPKTRMLEDPPCDDDLKK